MVKHKLANQENLLKSIKKNEMNIGLRKENEKKKRGFGLYTIFLDRAGCESLEALSDEVWTALDSESGLELLAGVA